MNEPQVHPKELVRIQTRHGRFHRIYVLTEDGRILTRYTAPTASRFVAIFRHVVIPSSEEGQTDLLIRIARRMGYTVVR